jgi:hypothetical protein
VCAECLCRAPEVKRDVDTCGCTARDNVLAAAVSSMHASASGVPAMDFAYVGVAASVCVCGVVVCAVVFVRRRRRDETPEAASQQPVMHSARSEPVSYVDGGRAATDNYAQMPHFAVAVSVCVCVHVTDHTKSLPSPQGGFDPTGQYASPLAESVSQPTEYNDLVLGSAASASALSDYGHLRVSKRDTFGAHSTASEYKNLRLAPSGDNATPPPAVAIEWDYHVMPSSDSDVMSPGVAQPYKAVPSSPAVAAPHYQTLEGSLPTYHSEANRGYDAVHSNVFTQQ